MDVLLERTKRMNRLFISFSGGRTSAMMTKILLDELRGKLEIYVLFANTGKEDERTLEFVNQCDIEFGFNVVWIEAVTHPNERKACSFKVVNFQSAARNAEPFERVIEKYGLPGPGFLHCTRELKTNPMYSFIANRAGWQNDSYLTAVGIRADEVDRMSSSSNRNLWYPLIDLGVTKKHVLDFWLKQPFNLQLPEHYGNCTTCWKKTDRKLMTIAVDKPEEFDFFRRMEAVHAHTGAGIGPRFFFRGRKTVDDIFRQAREPFERFTDSYRPQKNCEMDIGASCGESCEIETDE